jgi:hypothetical protein
MEADEVEVERINSKFPLVNPVAEVKPQGPGSFMSITFPDGYTYQLPPPGTISGAVDIYQQSDFLGSGDSKPPVPFDGSPVQYPIEDKYLSVPSITHRSDSNLAWLQGVAELKYELLELPGIEHNLRDMYRPTWYGTRAVEKAFQIARHVGKELGKAAIEEVLLYKAPTALTAPYDVADIAEALEPGFAVPEGDIDRSGDGGIFDSVIDFATGSESNSTPEIPDEFEQAAEIPSNAVWMTEAVDPEHELPTVQGAGLSSLYATTMFERAWNHMYASTDDSAQLDKLRTIYVRTLEQQQQIAQQTQVNVQQAPSRPDEGYWNDLYQHALNICTEFNDIASSQLEVLNST